MIRKFLFATSALAALAAADSRAGVIFTDDPIATDVNVRALEAVTPTTGIGFPNDATDPAVVGFETSGAFTIGGGEAFVRAVTGLNFFTLAPVAGQGFSAAEFNVGRIADDLIPGGELDTLRFVLTAVDNFGAVFTSDVFTFGPGSNRAAAYAIDDQLITSLTVSALWDGPDGLVDANVIADVRQIRVTAEDLEGAGPVVPEPGTLGLLALGGLGLAGGAARKRRKAAATAAA